jgi:ACS family D-galactonate transporter-like MFS transporter
VRRGLGRKPLLIAFTSVQCVLTLIFGFVVAAGGANVWVMAALLFGASTFFNAMQPIAHAMVAEIASPEQHGAAFGMNNLIGEIGAVLSPAVSGALRDATGGWAAAVFVDAGLIFGAIVLFLFVREAATTDRGDGAARRRRRFERPQSPVPTASSSTR